MNMVYSVCLRPPRRPNFRTVSWEQFFGHTRSDTLKQHDTTRRIRVFASTPMSADVIALVTFLVLGFRGS